MCLSFTEWLTKEGYQARTVIEIERAVNHLERWSESELIELRYSDLIKYIAEQQKKIKASTINQRLQAISKYYAYQKEQGEITHNPAQHLRVKNKKKPQKNYLTPEELEQLYENFPTAKTRDKVLLGMIVYQAADTGALRQLTSSHINLEKCSINLPPTKRSNARKLGLQPTQMLPLFRHLQPPKAFLFEGSIVDRLSYLLKQLKRQNAKVESIRQLRASVIAGWLKTYNLRQVQYMAGHRYVSSTERYKSDNLEALKESLDKYHPLG